ncbi:c-type cytochrome [Deminuibacter soli]|uniref:Photosynthetic reaction center cytochrome c subunit n=1 Tax=Deminuibacter soli TaxID=2291815 RepID=A0A3E1NK79_9BACT|nr:c-type cytochrome [Deminuibacter soli]
MHRKKIMVTLALSGCVLLGVAAYRPYEQPRKRNLKVLPENISRDSLDAIMDEFKVSLGVKCSFCHAPRATDPSKLDFGSDDKPEKEIARHMMRMTADINKQYFNFKNSDRPDTLRAVTCNTCHHGDAHPEEAGKTEAPANTK